MTSQTVLCSEAASRPASIDHLPNEIIAWIFDHLDDLADIVRASHVSKNWRTTAYGRPSFASHIKFIYSDEAGRNWEAKCALFVQQVTCSSLPLHLTIRYYGHEGLVLDTLVSVLSQHMDRVVSLELSLHARQPKVMFKILDRPAPLLEWLRATAAGRPFAYHNHQHLAPTIFTHANRLKSLILSSVDLPEGVTNLDSIEHLLLFNYSGAAQIARAVALCKQLRCLYFSVNHYTPSSDAALEAAMSIPAVARLGYVHLHMPKWVYTSYAYFMPHLLGPLRLELIAMPPVPTRPPATTTETLFSIKFTDQTGRERLLRGHNKAYYPEISREFRRHVHASRIVELSMGMIMLSVAAKLLPSLPCLEIFTLELTSVPCLDLLYPPRPRLDAPPIAVDDECDDMSPIACPSLRTVVIKGHGQAGCRVSWLAKFMGLTLGASCRKHLDLEMRGSIPVGDIRAISGYFSSILMYPQ